MQKILINQCRPGMVLAKPVTKDNGMILVAQETKLTEGIIRRLENMDIKHVVVQGHPVTEEDGDSVPALEHKLQRLEHMLRRHGQDSWMEEVKNFLQEYYKQRLFGQQTGRD